MKLVLAVSLANLMLVVGVADSLSLLAIGFIVGQGATLFFLSWWVKSERADRKAWTDALTEAHASAQALIRAADLRGLELLPKPTPKEIAG